MEIGGERGGFGGRECFMLLKAKTAIQKINSCCKNHLKPLKDNRHIDIGNMGHVYLIHCDILTSSWHHAAATSIHGIRAILSHRLLWRHVGRGRGVSWEK